MTVSKCSLYRDKSEGTKLTQQMEQRQKMDGERRSSLLFGVLNLVAAEANSTLGPFPSLVMSINQYLPLWLI